MATKNIRQSQEQIQTQQILFDTSLYEVPILAIERTLEKVFENPEIVESRLNRSSYERAGEPIKDPVYNPFFYASLFKSVNTEKPFEEPSRTPGGGLANLGDSLELAEKKPLLTQPDITYQVRGYGDFSIIPANHFRPSALQLRLDQLPKRVRPFAQWLMGQKNWIIKTLEACYFALGKAQSGFLLRLDPRELIELPVSRIDSSLNLPYDSTTYYRLMRYRFIEITSDSAYPL